MADLKLTKDETTLLNDALEGAITSAQRQQNTKGKTPVIREVYAKHEQVLRALQAKINA